MVLLISISANENTLPIRQVLRLLSALTVARARSAGRSYDIGSSDLQSASSSGKSTSLVKSLLQKFKALTVGSGSKSL
jgi:hypothetical protein